MLGVIIGAASGIVQFLLLSSFTRAATHGKISGKAVFIALFQFLLPLIVLLCCALLLSQSILWTGVSMAASLTICAVSRFLLTLKR